MNVIPTLKIIFCLLVLTLLWSVVSVTSYRRLCFPALPGQDCLTIPLDEGIRVDCSALKIHICIPYALNPDLTELDVSYNTYEYIHEGQFDRYPKIKVLIMKHMERVPQPSFSPFAFRRLYSLEIIDLTNFSSDPLIHEGPEFEWPPSIRVLNVSRNFYSKINCERYKLFEELIARDLPNMKKCPRFHPIAPVRYIDLTNTPVQDLSSETIAPLCQLDRLTFNSNLFTSKSYCECKKIELWMDTYSIKHSNSLNCISKQDSSTSCDVSFNDSILSLRRICFKNVVLGETSSQWLLVIPLVTFIVLSLLVPSYLYVKHFRKKHHKTRKKHKSLTTPSSESGESTDRSEQDDSSNVEVAEPNENAEPVEE